MQLTWEDCFEISVLVRGDEVTIAANRAGMLSLARHLQGLADEAPGAHLHLDVSNALEDGSCELVIERVATCGTAAV